MKRNLILIVFLILAVLASAQAGKKKKALFVWGGWEGHEPKQCVDIFAPWLQEQGFEVEISHTLDSYLDAAKLKSLDLIVHIFTMSDIKPEQAPSPTIAASLQKIAEQNKALREREERVKAYEDIARVVDPLKLSRAAASRDPLAVLEAVGMRYEDVVDRVLQNQPKGAQPAKVEEKPEADGIVAELQKKLAKLEAEQAAEKVSKARSELVQKGLSFVSAEKFPLAARLGEEAVNEAVDVLLEFAETLLAGAVSAAFNKAGDQ